MSSFSSVQSHVDTKGITSKVRLEETISGHLAELNGKFKLRVTEVTIAPDGRIGMHHHVGPGVRYVMSGKVTFVEGGTTNTYSAGDYFYESGNLAHAAYNHTNAPLRIAFFEVLPADWAGPTVIPPKAY